jgi:pSer/pThr/pTyr-binding forkhead associated (FHA) protein
VERSPHTETTRHSGRASTAASRRRTASATTASSTTARATAVRATAASPEAAQGAEGPLRSRRETGDHGEITLGRDPSCSFAIDDDSFISQLHFRIYDYEGQPMLEDLGSTNGTFHNGNKVVGAKLLHPGDRIQVGTTVIEAQ